MGYQRRAARFGAATTRLEAPFSAERPMMTRTQRRAAALRRRWLEILLAEREQRDGQDGGDRRERALADLNATLDLMAERLCAAPDFTALSPEESTETERAIAGYFAQRARC